MFIFALKFLLKICLGLLRNIDLIRCSRKKQCFNWPLMGWNL